MIHIFLSWIKPLPLAALNVVVVISFDIIVPLELILLEAVIGDPISVVNPLSVNLSLVFPNEIWPEPCLLANVWL